MRLGQQPARQHPVRPESQPARAGEDRSSARIESWSAKVAAVENRVAGMLDPGIVIFGVEVLHRRAEVSAGVFVLTRKGQTVPMAVVVDLRITDSIGRECPA